MKSHNICARNVKSRSIANNLQLYIVIKVCRFFFFSLSGGYFEKLYTVELMFSGTNEIIVAPTFEFDITLDLPISFHSKAESQFKHM